MIVAAAIRHTDGKTVFTGKRHAIIIYQMAEMGLKTPIKGEQGFVDNEGTFLDRHAAGEHAIACGQIEQMRWPGMGLDSVEIFPRRREIE
jgi:hypothetical protein